MAAITTPIKSALTIQMESNNIIEVIERKIIAVTNSIIRLCNTNHIDTRSWILAIGDKQHYELCNSPLSFRHFDPMDTNLLSQCEKHFGIKILKVDHDYFLEILATL